MVREVGEEHVPTAGIEPVGDSLVAEVIGRHQGMHQDQGRGFPGIPGFIFRIGEPRSCRVILAVWSLQGGGP